MKAKSVRARILHFLQMREVAPSRNEKLDDNKGRQGRTIAWLGLLAHNVPETRQPEVPEFQQVRRLPGADILVSPAF
jgi:hypothetical protein